MALNYIGANNRNITYRGRAGTFLTPGRTTTPAYIMTIWNSTTTHNVAVNRLMVDSYQIAAKLISVPPQIVRTIRLAAAPTGGTILPKVPLDTSLTAQTGVTLLQDATADGTGSATALAAVSTGILTQELAPRIVTPNATTTASVNPFAEVADRMEFFVGEPDVILRPSQGIAIQLVNAGVATDRWVAVADWDEYLI